MNCQHFRDRLFLFQDDELPEPERDECQGHLDGCPACAEILAGEEIGLRVLKSKLERTPAPPGLDTRIRLALRAEGAGGRRRVWFRTPSFAAVAAATLLLALVVPTLIDERSPVPAGLHVHELVTVVDLDCDRAGRSLALQRRCSHPLHVNALKRADGTYWAVSPQQSEFRYLWLGREARGRSLVVEGRLFPETETIRLDAVERLEACLIPLPPVFGWRSC
ncbi:MAG TPA: zf-HC2 domain-containing protein [Candidatus Polarisedimenticolaceae bacterium]|nr:zf-HC2 domain-containing protein [Candidatus Polarisedimenticolaceae bacterium]